MNPPVDTAAFQFGVGRGGYPDEASLFGEMASKARAFIQTHRWAPPIKNLLLAFGVGGIHALYLVQFEHGIAGTGNGDTESWVVVGDGPSMVFETDDARTPARALELYCCIADDWADKVLAGDDLSDSYPIPVAATAEHAKMLKGRVEFIRKKLIPKAKRDAKVYARRSASPTARG